MKRSTDNQRSAFLAVLMFVAGTIHPAARAAVTSGPDMISAPASVASSGHTNLHQQAFDEMQSVTLPVNIEVDGGVFIPAGTFVDSHMIFFNTTGTQVHDYGQTWTFDGTILGVMSDEPATLEAASNYNPDGTELLAKPGTTYPGVDAQRGLEGPIWTFPDSYSVSGNSITVDMTATVNLGDYIRVVTAAPTPGVTFSLDYGSVTAGATGGLGIQPNDILTVSGPAIGAPNPASGAPGAPQILVTGASLGIAPGGGHSGSSCPGASAGPCGGPSFGEMDALSFGRDKGDGFYFSVDEHTFGNGHGAAPDVTSEGSIGMQASADFFEYLGPAPVASGTAIYSNTAIVDGDAASAFGLPGLGLVEPNPTPHSNSRDPGDNVDGMDLDTTAADLTGRIYFSLGGPLSVSDPLESEPPCWQDTACASGFSGAEILAYDPAMGSIYVYADAWTLGLEPDTDDVDALALHDNGDGIFDPAVDTIYFSVRRESTVIGLNDSRLNTPITEGDILTLPTPPRLEPSIVVTAAALDLSPNIAELNALDTFFSTPPPTCAGDMDGDGDTDVFDFTVFALNFGTSGQPPYTNGDLDGDGDCDVFDFAAFATDFGCRN